MDRRKFIILASAGIAATGIGYWYLNYFRPYPEFLARPEALTQLWDEATLREAGAAYRAQTPGENTTEDLLRELAGGTAAPLPDEAALRAGIQEDFAADRTVLVAGWVLSRTEARQCALYSLANSN